MGRVFHRMANLRPARRTHGARRRGGGTGGRLAALGVPVSGHHRFRPGLLLLADPHELRPGRRCTPAIRPYRTSRPFASTQAAALADATNISPAATITESNGVDASGRAYVQVTASYTFATITGFPGIPSKFALNRTVKMYVAANTPTNF